MEVVFALYGQFGMTYRSTNFCVLLDVNRRLCQTLSCQNYVVISIMFQGCVIEERFSSGR